MLIRPWTTANRLRYGLLTASGLLVGILFGGRATAALEFDQSTIVVPATVGQKVVTAVFRCKNTGDRPVVITRVRTTCGCTSASMGKKAVAAGETAEVPVEMKVQIDTGRQEKGVIVETEQAPFRYELAIVADIPVLMEIEPRNLLWICGGDAATKTVHFTPVAAGARVTKHECSDPAFEVELRAVADGWAMSVKPLDLRKQRFGAIEVGIATDGEQAMGKIMLNIVPPPPKRRGLLERLFGDE